jgi:hypothetical protein
MVRTKNNDIHTALSTLSPTTQFKNVVPSSYRNFTVFETETSSSAARTA